MKVGVDEYMDHLMPPDGSFTRASALNLEAVFMAFSSASIK